MSGRRPIALSGSRLALLRLAIFGSQVALAHELTRRGLPTTRQAVSRWEREEAIPSEERLELLCVLMALSPEQIHRLFWPHLLGEAQEDARIASSAVLSAASGSSGRRVSPMAEADAGAPTPFCEGGR